MKQGVAAKRRWKLYTTAVPALVLFSLLVPLLFLLGLHNHFPSGYLSDDSSSSVSRESGFEGYDKVPKANDKCLSVSQNDRLEATVSGMASVNHSVGDVEIQIPCELEYGTYCIWSVKHKAQLKDFLVKKLKDQLFLARAYFPSIAKIKSEDKFSREVKQNIQDHERILSEAIVDTDLPKFGQENIKKMEETITKAKSFNVVCTNVCKKLAQILDLTEDEAQFHTRQGSFLYHLGAQTIPKSLHCLSLRLTVEYFKNPSSYTEMQNAEKSENPVIQQHYVIFSKNVLASSVTVNSTVMNAKVSRNLVFHLLTDEQNYYTMKLWFSQHSYKDAIVEVLNVESFSFKSSRNSNPLHMSFSEEF